jgi:hypothetical protein
MNVSEQIHLKLRVRDALLEKPFTDADLILRSFGLAGLDLDSEYYNYDPANDVRNQVHAASDAQLLQLEGHLFGDVGIARRSGLELSPTMWSDGSIRIFLSHLSEHQDYANQVADELKLLRIDAFVAHVDIEPDTEWQEQIEIALKTCDAFVGLLHVGFSASHWTQQEVGWALGRGIPLCMIRLGEDPVGFKAKLQASRATQIDARTAASRITVWLSKDQVHGAEVTKRVLASLHFAHSFSDARDAALRLQQMGKLSSEMLDGIQDAYWQNNQISPHHVAVPILEQIFKSHNRTLVTA